MLATFKVGFQVLHAGKFLIHRIWIKELTPWIVLNLLCLPFWLVMSLWLALSALAEIGDIF